MGVDRGYRRSRRWSLMGAPAPVPSIPVVVNAGRLSGYDAIENFGIIGFRPCPAVRRRGVRMTRVTRQSSFDN